LTKLIGPAILHHMTERLPNTQTTAAAPVTDGWRFSAGIFEGPYMQSRNWKGGKYEEFDLLILHISGFRPIVELVHLKSARPAKNIRINPKDIIWGSNSMTTLFVDNSPEPRKLTRKLSGVCRRFGLPRLPRDLRRDIAEITAYSQKAA